MKRQALLTMQANLKLAIKLIIIFSLFSRGEFLASVWQEEGKFEVLKRCSIQIYPTIMFFSVLEKTNGSFQHR